MYGHYEYTPTLVNIGGYCTKNKGTVGISSLYPPSLHRSVCVQVVDCKHIDPYPFASTILVTGFDLCKV